MARKDITNLQVVEATYSRCVNNFGPNVIDILTKNTGQCEKVCLRATERAYRCGYIECGVSIARPWLTDKGFELYNNSINNQSVKYRGSLKGRFVKFVSAFFNKNH